MAESGTFGDGENPRSRRAVREARDRRIVAAKRRGVSLARIAELEGITAQRAGQICSEWDDVPSVPRNGVVVDAGQEVRRTLVAFEQAIEDLGELVANGETPKHVKLGAIGRALDAHERRLRLMASAGYISRSLASPLIEQEVASAMSLVTDVLRRHQVDESVVREIAQEAERRKRQPVLEAAA